MSESAAPPVSPRPPRKHSPLIPVLVGFAAAVPFYVLFTLHPDGALDLLTLILAFAGGIYFGVALRDGSRGRLVGEAVAGGLMVLVAALGLWWTPLWLALGFGVHGVWNLAHHTGHVQNGIRRWFPPMYAAWEWVVAAMVIYYTSL